jgi:hypothetical protein
LKVKIKIVKRRYVPKFLENPGFFQIFFLLSKRIFSFCEIFLDNAKLSS